MKKVTLLFLGLMVLPACLPNSTRVTRDPVIEAILACTAGITSKYKLSGNIETDLQKAVTNKKLNLKAEAEVEEWVRGYLFEKVTVTEGNAVEAYKLYLDCYRGERMRESAGLHSRLISIKERSQSLWNKYDEAMKYAHKLTLSDAEQYAAVAASLAGLNEADLDHKNNIIKFDRQSFAARQGERSDGA